MHRELGADSMVRWGTQFSDNLLIFYYFFVWQMDFSTVFIGVYYVWEK